MKLPPLLVYSVLRLLAFLVPLAIMWFFFPILRGYWWLTVVFATLIGTSISVLFLRKPLSDVSSSVYEKRSERGHQNQAALDAEAEDAELDALNETDAAPGAEGSAETDSAPEGDRKADADPA